MKHRIRASIAAIVFVAAFAVTSDPRAQLSSPPRPAVAVVDRGQRTDPGEWTVLTAAAGLP